MNLDAVLQHLRSRGYDPEPVPPLPRGFDRQREPELFLQPQEGGDAIAVWTHGSVRETTVIQAQAAARKLEARALLVHEDISEPARRWAQRYGVDLLGSDDMEEGPDGDVKVSVPVAPTPDEAAPADRASPQAPVAPEPTEDNGGIWDVVNVPADETEDMSPPEPDAPEDLIEDIELPTDVSAEAPTQQDPEPSPPANTEPDQAPKQAPPTPAAPPQPQQAPASTPDVGGPWGGIVAAAQRSRDQDPDEAQDGGEDASGNGSGLRTEYADDQVELMVRATPRSPSPGNGGEPRNGTKEPAPSHGEDDGTDAELMVSPRVQEGAASGSGGSTSTSGESAPAVVPQGRQRSAGSRKEASVSTDLDKIAEDVMRETEERPETEASMEGTGAELLDGRNPNGAAEDEEDDATGKPTDHAISRHDPDLWGTSGRLDSVRTKLRDAGDSPHARARGGGVKSSWLQGIREG